MSISKESIYSTVLSFLDKYNFYFYQETKQEWIITRTNICFEILNTDDKIIDIFLRNTKKTSLTLAERDIQQFVYKTVLQFYRKDFSNRFINDTKSIEESMMFRIELFKDGWSIEQIEKYIYKYIYNVELEEINLDYFECLYHNFLVQHSFYKAERTKKIGRPTLPTSLKEYIKKRNVMRVRKTMRTKYQCYQNLKNSMLTVEELELIKDKIKDEKIINKLQKLTL